MPHAMRLRLSVLAAALVLIGSGAMAEPQIGGVAQKEYAGATGTPSGAAPEYLYFNHDVFAGEVVSTPASGSTKLRFLDRTEIQVGANSSVVLDRFVYDPSSRTGEAAIKFSKGIFRFVTGDIATKDAVKLTTPTTSLVIRGTNFKLYVGEDGGTILQVDEGAVDVTPCGNGQTVHAAAGQALKVTAGCAVQTVGLSAVPQDPGTDGSGPGGGSNNPTHPGNPPAPRGRDGGQG
jgi:FecR protein